MTIKSPSYYYFLSVILGCLFFNHALFSQENKRNISSEISDYYENALRATSYYHKNSPDSCIYYFEKAFSIREALLFDELTCAKCYILNNQDELAQAYLESIIKSGYPLQVLLNDNVFIKSSLNNTNFTNHLQKLENKNISEEIRALNLELKRRVDLDSKTRNGCYSRESIDCKEWKKVTDDNLDFVKQYLLDNDLACFYDLGFGITNFYFILLHSKSKSAYEYFNPILLEQVLNDCFSAASYAYWGRWFSCFYT